MEHNDFTQLSRCAHRALLTIQRHLSFDPKVDLTVAGAVPVHQRQVDRAFAYLEAITPYNHPARPTLLNLLDTIEHWKAHGGPIADDEPGVALKLAGDLVAAFEDGVPEVYTITSIADVDTWLARDDRHDLTVRLIAPEGAVGVIGSWPNHSPEPGHQAATLVFYMDTLPVAQVAVNQLLNLSSVEAAATVAAMPHDRCGHKGCTHKPGYVVKFHDALVVTCLEHLGHVLDAQGAYVIALQPSS